jgi:hypothetical protein
MMPPILWMITEHRMEMWRYFERQVLVIAASIVFFAELGYPPQRLKKSFLIQTYLL